MFSQEEILEDIVSYQHLADTMSWEAKMMSKYLQKLSYWRERWARWASKPANRASKAVYMKGYMARYRSDPAKAEAHRVAERERYRRKSAERKNHR